MKLSALAILLVMSCAASQTQSDAPWRIDVTTSGGFAGRGAGNYTLDSDGKLTVTMNGRSCSYELTADELARWDRIVDAAKPDAWNESYAPEDRCCDRIEYKLTLDRAGAQRATEWIDDPLPMPADLLAIANAVTGPPPSLRMDYGTRCR